MGEPLFQYVDSEGKPLPKEIQNRYIRETLQGFSDDDSNYMFRTSPALMDAAAGGMTFDHIDRQAKAAGVHDELP